jgi:hypothetical protein
MLLRLVLFLCGAVVMSVEILASRVLAVEFGDNLAVWGALIGTFIGSLSLGYWLGGIAADKWPTRIVLGVMISLSGILFTVTAPFSNSITASISGLRMEGDYALWLKPLLACTIIYCAPVALLGAVSPYCVRLAARDLTRIGKKVGGFYATSSFGSILGTFLTAFYLIVLAGIRSIILAEGLFLLALAIPVYLAGFFFEDSPAETPQSPRVSDK